jgi:hypothetical protein
VPWPPQPRLTIQRKSVQPRRHPGRPPAHPGRLPHAAKTVTIEPGDTTLRIIDHDGELIATVPRNGTGEITRFKAYGTRKTVRPPQ